MLELVPEKVHRVNVVEDLAPCLGELEDGLEAKNASARMRCTPRCSIGLEAATEVLGTPKIKHKVETLSLDLPVPRVFSFSHSEGLAKLPREEDLRP